MFVCLLLSVRLYQCYILFYDSEVLLFKQLNALNIMRSLFRGISIGRGIFFFRKINVTGSDNPFNKVTGFLSVPKDLATR